MCKRLNYTNMSVNDLELCKTNYKPCKLLCRWYRKFSLSFCLYGVAVCRCSMGAIVRKGGFGMPILIAVIYFVFFHVLNVIGEKIGKGLVIPPFAGMWLASLVLMPLALFLTYKANNDSVLF